MRFSQSVALYCVALIGCFGLQPLGANRTIAGIRSRKPTLLKRLICMMLRFVSKVQGGKKEGSERRDVGMTRRPGASSSIKDLRVRNRCVLTCS